MQHTLSSIRLFAHHHDEMKVFHAVYLVLTLVSAILLNLGVFAILIIFHMLLDVWKYRELHNLSWGLVIKGVIHESLVDITLLMIALTFSVYVHHSTGMMAVSGLLRAEMTLLHFIGTALPKFFILEHLLKVVAHVEHYLKSVHEDTYRDWSMRDAFYASAIVLCGTLLYLAPMTLGTHHQVIESIILWELTPWNV